MSLSQEKLDELSTNARLSLADEAEKESERISPDDWIFRQIKAWGRWYLRKNQPLNYVRLTQIIPPGFEENQNAWICRIQIWKGGVSSYILEQYRISVNTYDMIMRMWNLEPKSNTDMNYAIYKPHAKLEQ